MNCLRKVAVKLTAAESHLPGEFVVRRALPRRELRRVGGFVFFDHFNETDISPEKFDVPPHPHIGLQTVTYLFDGEILHTDSLDQQQLIRPRDVNWMTAGRAITHSEQVVTPQPRIHGLQTWVGLPHKDRRTDPAFEHFDKSILPQIHGDGYKVTVIAGECAGEMSPIPTFQELVYLDIEAKKGADVSFAADPGHELAVYVCEGEIAISGETVSRHDLAKLSDGDSIAIDVKTDSRFVIIGGEPLPEPTVIYWNFIADTIGEAKQAMIDWEDGKFPAVPLYKKYSTTDNSDNKDVMQML